MDGDSSRCCVVAWWHAEWGEPVFKVHTGLLFGLPLAVTSFNRSAGQQAAPGHPDLDVL